MWRSSSNPVRRARARRGFTLIEAMVSLLLLVIVLTVAMTMLFQMRAFAERQQFYMLPRQAARRAADYLAYYVAGASDLNDHSNPRQSPNALIMYYNLGGNVVQASYDNLTGAETGNAITVAGVSTKFGDLGTDILTLVTPINPAKYRAFAPFPPVLGASSDLWFNFRGGCAGGDAANLAAFQAATGFDGTNSAMLMLVDRDGNWIYFQIPSAGYLADGACADVTTFKNIHVQADTASGTLPAPPNGSAAMIDPVNLVTGIQVISFRVLTDPVDRLPKLQQKLGLFDPTTDNPGTAFVNVMENIEDLQFAYLYRNGTIWNTSSQTIANGVAGCAIADCDNHIPPQAGPGAVTPEGLDVTDVVGIRLSVTARSPLLSLGARQLTNVDVKADISTRQNLHFRPASENHPVTFASGTIPVYDQFDHYRATTTLLVRNRALGN